MFNDILKNNKAQYIYIVVAIASQTADIFLGNPWVAQGVTWLRKI